MRSLANILWLGTKELRAFMRDYVLLGLVVYSFSLAIIAQAQGSSQEVRNASIAIVDEDHSALSRRIAQAFLPPYFQKPQPIAERDIMPAMNSGRFTFVLDIPPNFERDVLGKRQPAIQLDVDATAMVQAGLGADYAQQIITTEIDNFLSRAEGGPVTPVNLIVRIAFNPNIETAWFTSIMGIINNVTMLAIILAGAAIVREREHGTMDHLLVMPLTPFEIAMSKVWANGLVIVIAVGTVALLRGARPASHSDRRVGAAVPVRRRDLPVLCNGGRDFARHHCALDAAARAALHAGVSADEHAFRQQYPARKHAALVGDPDAGLAFNPFRLVRAGDFIPRRRFRGGLARVSVDRCDRWPRPAVGVGPLPQSRGGEPDLKWVIPAPLVWPAD